jgi:SAM-dependent methyltransferase
LRFEAASADADILTGSLVAPTGETYPIADGIPDLTFPRSQTYLDENPGTYDDLIAFIASLLKADLPAAKRRAVEALELAPGDRVLDLGCGPGPNFPYLFERIGRRGEIVAADISPGMLRKALARPVLAPGNLHPVLVNGVHLPFPDACFDAVLQIGTLNRFTDIPAALREMARVTKPRGKVVAGDEALGPWLEGTEYAAVLGKFGGLFKGGVPISSVPRNAEDVRVRWDFGHAYYSIEFRVGDPPELDLDVTLPGRDVTVRQVLARNPPARKD